MFTGLIETLGPVQSNGMAADGLSRRLVVGAPFAPTLAIGESVAVNGTCLTVVAHDQESFSADVSPTTLTLTTLGSLAAGQRVNLERSVTPSTRLGGHWVQGHVDTHGTVTALTQEGDAHHVTIGFPRSYGRWVLPQGSVTLDGVSLTIVDRGPDWLAITVIPHTWEQTTIKDWSVGAAVNIEFDVLGKYVEHLLTPYENPTRGTKEERS